MRKIYLISLILMTTVFLTRCMSEKETTERSIKKLLPPVPASFSSADSARLIANWTVGIRFFKSNCSGCHGVYGNGKDSIPNFSKKQFDDYKTSYLAGDTANHAVAAKMTEEELNNVFLFLTDIKR